MKSLFLKLFLSIVLILLCSISIIGAFLYSQLSVYFERQNIGYLRRDAGRVADNIVLYFEWPASPPSMLTEMISSVAEESESEILIINSSSEILILAGEDRFIDKMTSYTYTTPETIDASFYDSIIEHGMISGFGNLGGYYPKTVYTVGVPIISSTGSLYGAVIMSTQVDFLNYFASDLINMILLSLGVSLSIALILTYLITSGILKPIRAMGTAANQFAQGKFDTRINVKGKDEIAGLAHIFNGMAKSLEKNEQTRQDFINNITHEIKTPMTTIKGFIDGIIDGTIPEDKQGYYLGVISGEVTRLSRMVSQSLMASKLASGEQVIKVSDFDIGELTRRTLLGFEQLVETKSLRCNVDIPEYPCMVSADPDAMIQVIYNLTDNAIKYADDKGIVDISIKETSEGAHIEIFNTGKGIPADELPMIFDRYYKADRSRGIDRESFGLGLFIVKTILNRQSINIDVESEEGKYCKFFFTIPYAN